MDREVGDVPHHDDRVVAVPVGRCCRQDREERPADGSPGPVAGQIQQVEQALQAPEYAELSADDRNQIQQALARITQRMGDRQRVDELPPQVQAQVFNDQERVNQLLARAHDDSRQVCTYQRTTGSNMPKGRCLTVAERRRIEERARR